MELSTEFDVLGTLNWFANFDVLFMGSNSPREFGLGSSILLFKMLD